MTKTYYNITVNNGILHNFHKKRARMLLEQVINQILEHQHTE